MKSQSFIGAGVSGGVLVALFAGLAWACTNQARIITVNSLTGPPAMVLSLTGNRVPPMAPVEVRWNALDGARIASAVADQAGNFTAQITVPDVAPGIYTIISSAGEFAVARTAFEVTAPPAAKTPVQMVRPPASSDLWNGFTGSNATVGATATPEAPSGRNASLAVGLGLLGASLAGASFGAAFMISSRRRKLPSGAGSGSGGSPMA